jgi:hypothetical protein
MATLFARYCRDSDAWSEATESYVPLDVIRDLANPNRMCSVWRVEDELDSPDLIRIAAAMQRGRKSANAVTLRFISKHYIDKHKLKIDQTPGDSLDTVLNGSNIHCELHLDTIETAICVAKGFIARQVKNGHIKVFTEGEIKQQLVRSIGEKRILIRSLTLELVSSLVEGDFLKVQS